MHVLLCPSPPFYLVLPLYVHLHISFFLECFFRRLLNPPLDCQSLNVKRTLGATAVDQGNRKLEELSSILQLSSGWKITIKNHCQLLRHSAFLTGIEPVYKEKSWIGKTKTIRLYYEPSLSPRTTMDVLAASYRTQSSSLNGHHR